ncbi:FixH family protein [Ktedonospora formicarum]|uniref:YtkA-like domain-containing protein n=1 Tax=Ktedonospora formicarum TaxID=2778364 RepID=A0A8J3MS35_9CHLR|nr:FixH family protein [Ktedonospora formicarum]GHO42935.1 hypothetical protein KSX_10980 [Ktedonospora formicarum]
MRVRPFFWLLLLCVSVAILSIAAFRPTYIPAVLRVQVNEESLFLNHTALIQVHLSDTQGQPIDKAQITPSARMLAMEMGPTDTSVISQGKGQYAIHLHLNMAGAWEITIQTQADGFSALSYVLQVQVSSQDKATVHTEASSWSRISCDATLQQAYSPTTLNEIGARTSSHRA